jgi:putative FmdB family regulatory protein
MPTYVYECSACTKVFEVQQRITEDPLDSCDCGSKGTVKRLIQPIAVMFKGSGFHINDYAASTTSPPAASASSPSKDGESAATAAPAAVSTDGTPSAS